MTPDPISIRHFVYRRFAEDAVASTVPEIAEALHITEREALTALQSLDTAHLLVLDAAREKIVMAHPWASHPMGFVVASHTQKWWGGCAWDSFAIPSLVGQSCLVATHCPSCERPLALDVLPDQPPAKDLVAHLLVPVTRMWDDVVHTCSNQRLFCDEAHVRAWLAEHNLRKGAVLDLQTLWSLAIGWYAGRLSAEYRRRTPEEAAAFFTELGLTGHFWQTA